MEKTPAVKMLEEKLEQHNARIAKLRAEIEDELRRCEIITELLRAIIEAEAPSFEAGPICEKQLVSSIEELEEIGAVVKMPPETHRDSLEAAKKRQRAWVPEMEREDEP